MEIRLELPPGSTENGIRTNRTTEHTGLFYKMTNIEDSLLIYSIQAIAESRLRLPQKWK